MQSCRFDNFHVLPENRAAYDRCLRVANREEGIAGPLVLMGGNGQGKTHLLWAIVNQVRERYPDTALALITPREFPARVRQLARDPEPIQKSRHAILLIDSLAQFREDAADLEGVVEAFLANHFSVVLATNRPPIQIEAFSADFRRRLTAADMVTLGGQLGSRGAGILSPGGDGERYRELEARCTALLAERDATATRMERSQRRVVQLEEEIAALLQKYAALEGTERQARDASRELVRLQGEHEVMRVEADTAREEREAARATVRLLEAENRHLREELGRSHDLPLQLTEAREERDNAWADSASLRMQLDALAAQIEGLEEELEAEREAREHLQGQALAAAGAEDALREERARREAAEEETRRVAEQTAALLDQVIATHPEAADATKELFSLIAEFLERLREQRSTADFEMPARLEGILEGGESAAQRSLRAELAELASEREMQSGLYEESRAEQARLDVELGMARGQLRETLRERDVARQTHRIALTELDAMRDQSQEELAQARRELAALRWHVEALALRVAESSTAPASVEEIAAALATLAEPGSLSSPEPPEPLFEQPQLFEEAHRGRALLQEISRQLAETGKAPESTAQSEGPLTRAVREALSWDDPGYSS